MADNEASNTPAPPQEKTPAKSKETPQPLKPIPYLELRSDRPAHMVLGSLVEKKK